MKADIPMNKDIYEYYGDINVNKASYIPVTQEKIAPQNGTVGVIVGTGRANNTNFKGVERKISFYVGNVSLTASEQNIIDYFKNKIPGGSFECIKLKTYCGMQSFKLTANLSSKKGLENSNNWPEGVRVRPWVRKNKMSTNTKKNTMAGRNGV